MRIFKSEMRELQHEGKSEEEPPRPNPVQSERVDTPAPEQNHTDARPA
jgi:sec-independent protein translocase protein TatA